MACASVIRPPRIAATAAHTGTAAPARNARATSAGAVATPSVTALRLAKMCAGDAPPAQLQPERKIAARRRGAGEQQVAQAGQSRHRLRPAAERHRQPGEFGKAARHQRRPRVLAEARADDRAGGDRDDVFRRPADLRADRIVVAVEPERRGRQRGHDLAAQHLRVRRRHRGRRQPGRDFVGEIRPCQDRRRPARLRRGEHFERQRQRARLDAFRAAQQRPARWQAYGNLPQMLHRHRQQNQVGRRQR